MNAEHLNGAIGETFRLPPPVPSGLPRLTPPGGITIGDTFTNASILVNGSLFVPFLRVFVSFTERNL